MQNELNSLSVWKVEGFRRCAVIDVVTVQAALNSRTFWMKRSITALRILGLNYGISRSKRPKPCNGCLTCSRFCTDQTRAGTG